MTLIDATDKQFRILDDATILFQADPSNPLPGNPVARLVKGDALLAPTVLLMDNTTEDALPRLQAFVTAHVAAILGPVLACTTGEGITTPAARAIATRVGEALGAVQRAELDADIAVLDADGRKELRAKGVRLGPLLIYLPLLSKPVAVHVRALLWSLWHDAPLPAPVPHDGAVSQSVDATTANADFYRTIGYPMYGPRICRIDMLDRVVTEIYDTAKDGKFTAQHKMAEWLGCGIADLYAILSAMGHRLVHDPATVVTQQGEPDVPEATVDGEQPAAAPVPQAKPELATFQLRRGQAHKERVHTPRPERTSSPRPEHRAPSNKTKPDFSRKKKPVKPIRTDEPRNFSAPSKTEREDSNPFAALKNLKF
ncbi:MAG: hypothetical protein V4621_00490 [Pseudomonadota bacterium]